MRIHFSNPQRSHDRPNRFFVLDEELKVIATITRDVHTIPIQPWIVPEDFAGMLGIGRKWHSRDKLKAAILYAAMWHED